jgi:hypothetical protein
MPNTDTRTQPNGLFLLAALATALIVRLILFNGVSLHDDVNYWMQSIATGLAHSWPPFPSHWHTRLGFILPCALLLKIFGLKLWTPYLFTMLGGLAEIALTYFIAREFTSERTARLAAWLGVFFPLNILYSSFLFVDLWAGVLAAASLLFWIRALKTDAVKNYLLASLCFGLAWLCRETIIMCAPIYLALWWQAGRWRRPQLLWALPPALLILGGELLLYQLTAGNWHYRLDAMLHQQKDASNLDLIASSGRGGFFFAPIFQLLTSHDLGGFLLAGLAVTIFYWRKIPTALALWLVVGYAWLAWGTTVPYAWVTLQRDPRYISPLTAPCLIAIAIFLCGLKNNFLRNGLFAALAVVGLLGASLSAGQTALTAHKRFVASEFNRADTVLEPFTYFGARAAQNFSVADSQPRFACASDLGRNSTVAQINYLPGARTAACADAHYLVLSVREQPEKWKLKVKEGWRKVKEIPGDAVFARRALAHVLLLVRPHNARFAALAEAPGLVVLENPNFPAPQN